MRNLHPSLPSRLASNCLLPWPSQRNTPPRLPPTTMSPATPTQTLPNTLRIQATLRSQPLTCLFDFVVQLLPTAEELAVKEDVRKLLEPLIRTIEPDSHLLSLGSITNGFSLRNSGEH